MFGFRKKRPDPYRDMAHEAMAQADRALEERAAGLRKAMRDMGIGVDAATVDLIDALAAGFDESVKRMAGDLNGEEWR